MKISLLLAATALGAAVTGFGVPLSASATQTTKAAVPECTSSDLATRYHGADAAMSHVFGRIVLTNVSDHPCRTGGFGGLSYVGGGDGTQIGAAATRDHSRPTRTFVLEPGERATGQVSETSYAPYPKKKCRPTPVDGFRVYVPDSTVSRFIAHPTTGCANPKVHLLSHRAYRPS